MVQAYVLIRTQPGAAREASQRLRGLQNQIPELKSVNVVTGPYDIIARIEAADNNRVGQIVAQHVQGSGVASTITCIAVELG